MAEKLVMSGSPSASVYGKGERRGAMHGRVYGSGVIDGEKKSYEGSDPPPTEFGKYDVITTCRNNLAK